MDTSDAKARIRVIDVARFYAMALVFYGHFIEAFMLLKNPAAAGQYKFIYAFHMVLFIVLAGCVAREREVDWGPADSRSTVFSPACCRTCFSPCYCSWQK